MLEVIQGTLLPVVAVAAAGFVYGRFVTLDLRSFTGFVLYLSAPCLILSSLSGVQVAPSGAGLMVLAVLLVQGASGGLGYLAARGLGAERVPDWRAFVLASAFPNAANIPLPVAMLAFGPEGFSAQILYYVASALVHLSVGVALLNDSGGVKAALKMPILHAAVIGLGLSVTGTSLPGPVSSVLDLLGKPAVPMMLFALGYRLRTLKASRLTSTFAVAVCRLGGGLGAGYAAAWLLGLDGWARAAVILGSGMPTAVVNFVLATEYDRDSELVASAILVTTLASVLFIPFLVSSLLP